MKAITRQITALLAVLLLSGGPFTALASGDFSDYMQRAARAFNEQDLQTSLQWLQKAQPLASGQQQRAEWENSLGWLYFNQGRSVQASEHLRRALGLAQGVGNDQLARKAANNLGVLKYTQGDLTQARLFFSSRWAIGSETSGYYLGLIERQLQAQQVNGLIAKGVNHRYNQNFVSAVEAYDQAIELMPQHQRALEYKGYAQYRLGQADAALNTLKQAYELDPDSLNIVINLMKSYCLKGDMQGALNTLEQNAVLLRRNKETLLGDGELTTVCGRELLRRI